jgi:UDP-N-acetylmuramate: L-alanyl-gamma-D-glutamyl-meso-diaminopimelate ligase
MEVFRDRGGITFVDDFAHHPTAIRETLRAARMRWPGRRIVALFEPRSATNRRSVHEAETAAALGTADLVGIVGHARLLEIPEAERFSPARVARRTGGRAFDDATAMASWVASVQAPGDVVVLLSNGDFGGLRRMLDAPR